MICDYRWHAGLVFSLNCFYNLHGAKRDLQNLTKFAFSTHQMSLCFRGIATNLQLSSKLVSATLRIGDYGLMPILTRQTWYCVLLLQYNILLLKIRLVFIYRCEFLTREDDYFQFKGDAERYFQKLNFILLTLIRWKYFKVYKMSQVISNSAQFQLFSWNIYNFILFSDSPSNLSHYIRQTLWLPLLV